MNLPMGFFYFIPMGYFRKGEWADSISTTALRTLSERQWNRPKRLPLAEDKKKLTEYLRNKLEDAMKKLMSPNCLPGDWRDVAKLTLVQVILFNRRRSGEVERIPQSAYENRSSSFDDDIMKTLSTWEQHLCKSLTRFEIRGKRSRKVPVLLTHQMKICLFVCCLTAHQHYLGH